MRAASARGEVRPRSAILAQCFRRSRASALLPSPCLPWPLSRYRARRSFAMPACPEQGRFWMQVAPELLNWTEQFALNSSVDSIADGDQEPIANHFGGPLTARMFPAPEALAEALNADADALGFDPVTLDDVSFGDLDFSVMRAQVRRLALGGEIGVLDWISVGFRAPFTLADMTTRFAFDSTSRDRHRRGPRPHARPPVQLGCAGRARRPSGSHRRRDALRIQTSTTRSGSGTTPRPSSAPWSDEPGAGHRFPRLSAPRGPRCWGASRISRRRSRRSGSRCRNSSCRSSRATPTTRPSSWGRGSPTGCPRIRETGSPSERWRCSPASTSSTRSPAATRFRHPRNPGIHRRPRNPNGGSGCARRSAG